MIFIIFDVSGQCFDTRFYKKNLLPFFISPLDKPASVTSSCSTQGGSGISVQFKSGPDLKESKIFTGLVKIGKGGRVKFIISCWEHRKTLRLSVMQLERSWQSNDVFFSDYLFS